MKKSKIFLVVISLALLAALLVGCSSVSPQKVLDSQWGKYEAITYDVTRVLPDDDDILDNNPTILGEQTVITERIDKGSITIGSNPTVDKFTGTVVTYNMTMSDGSYMQGQVAFTSSFVPVAASRKVFVKSAAESGKPDTDLRQRVDSQYIGKSYNYKGLLEELSGNTVTSSKELDGSIKLKDWNSAPYIDSLMLYHVGRSSFNGKNGAFRPIAFNVPSYNEGALKETSCNLANKPDIDIKIGETIYKTSQVGFAYTQKFPGPGTPVWAHYATEPIEGLGNRVVIKMVEGNMLYVYKSHTTVKP